MSRQGSYRARFDDPEARRHSLPTYNRRDAPEGLATRRQLREAGLCPGGAEPVAQVMWVQWRRDAVAYLYDLDRARPKRVPSAAQLGALDKAPGRRQTCRDCGKRQDYCVPKAGPYAGQCVECMTPAGESAAA